LYQELCTHFLINTLFFMGTPDGAAPKEPKEYVDPWVSEDTM
jgi:hypothetical protein